MPAPPHIGSFQQFSERLPGDHLRASIAFGLFMQSEHKWVVGQNPEPNEAKCRNYHHDFLNNHEINRFIEEAGNRLNQFANAVVEQKRDAFLTETLKHHKRFRWKGALEALIGACAWTALLIGVSAAAHWGGIDLLEVAKHWAGVH
jgi:hypothetical protein